MREGIHPQYVETTVTCACGYTFKTRSTKPVIKLEMCSNCHPFFTGKQKLVDSAGRVERFTKRFSKTEGKMIKTAKVAKPKTAVKKVKGKVFSTAPRRKKLTAVAAKTETPKKEK
ncbi:MAG: 50S ribosomal protein L31 [Elusimicrobiota bacterium]